MSHAYLVEYILKHIFSKDIVKIIIMFHSIPTKMKVQNVILWNKNKALVCNEHISYNQNNETIQTKNKNKNKETKQKQTKQKQNKINTNKIYNKQNKTTKPKRKEIQALKTSIDICSI